MAICAIPDASGFLQSVDTPIEYCTGFILLEPVDSANALHQLFDPAYLSAGDIQTAFMLGMTLPLLAYLTAWAYQTVINFASSDKEY
ncbi:hypothetical protein [Alkalimonas mucilaginosa]|uniref:Uncharacterized protein n=1 Tax=Alkalimonas mucilaginosa TaxID=3057676 RepID=A0ABU7JD36_9GAMM|nr:hypothetical protein [Alkalimonas sp. MEB004]MEE2023608.1 hypothetical protein [Alkalimonas sp. MEB004]